MDSPFDGLDANKELYIDFKAQQLLIDGEIFHTKITDDSMSPRLRKRIGKVFFNTMIQVCIRQKSVSLLWILLKRWLYFLIKYKIS